jgi:superoxide dismutase, Cu-Zn family
MKPLGFKTGGFMLALAMVALAFTSAQMMHTAEVRYTMLQGAMGMEGVMGSATIVTWDSGEHEVFLRVEGLKPSSGAYANHIHFNAAGDATCAAQSGDQVVGLTNLEPNADGVAIAYTKLPADVAYPAGTTYLNVHSNDPEPVGSSITCGDISMAGAM